MTLAVITNDAEQAAAYNVSRTAIEQNGFDNSTTFLFHIAMHRKNRELRTLLIHINFTRKLALGVEVHERKERRTHM